METEKPEARSRFADRLRPGAARSAAAKKQAEKKDKDKEKEEPKEPTEEELIKHGPSGYKVGTYVEIFGLESGDGKKLNGQKGRITNYLYDKIRYEVSLGPKKVSVRPVNLKEAEKPDKKWSYGNTCRLVCLRDVEDEQLRDANGCLGTLMSRSKIGTWSVISNGKIQSCPLEHLRVCTDEDEYMKIGLPIQTALSLAAVGTLHILLGFGILIFKLMMPEQFNMGSDDGYEEREQGFVSMVFNPTVPSQYAAYLGAMTVVWAFVVCWGTVAVCCVMHRCLWDPQTTFPQFAELALGRRGAKVLYRIGLGMVAALVLAAVVLHKKLVCPHLPPLGTVAEDVFFWGLVAVAAIVSQATCLIEVNYGWKTLAQRFGGAVLIWAAFKHMNATMSLYLPGVSSGSFAWLQMLKDYLIELSESRLSEETEEDRAYAERVRGAQEFAASSKFLQHPIMQRTVILRYTLLSYWPWTILVLPVFSSIVERVPENSKVAGSSLLRSLFAWLQWTLLFLCTCMLLSYAPDMYVAGLLPIPAPTEDGE